MALVRRSGELQGTVIWHSQTLLVICETRMQSQVVSKLGSREAASDI